MQSAFFPCSNRMTVRALTRFLFSEYPRNIVDVAVSAGLGCFFFSGQILDRSKQQVSVRAESPCTVSKCTGVQEEMVVHSEQKYIVFTRQNRYRQKSFEIDT